MKPTQAQSIRHKAQLCRLRPTILSVCALGTHWTCRYASPSHCARVGGEIISTANLSSDTQCLRLLTSGCFVAYWNTHEIPEHPVIRNILMYTILQQTLEETQDLTDPKESADSPHTLVGVAFLCDFCKLDPPGKIPEVKCGLLALASRRHLGCASI